MIRYVLLTFLLSFSNLGYSQNFGLPEEFQWRYTVKHTAPTPRMGQYWRDGIFLEDRIIVLNTHYLISLDYKGKEQWIYELPSEYLFSEAKIHILSETEMLVAITDNILKVNIQTGEMIAQYVMPAASDFAELIPRSSLIWKDKLYIFMGKELLVFDPKMMKHESVLMFHQTPKTKPIIYCDNLVIGFESREVLAIDPVKKQTNMILHVTENVRQPVVADDKLYIPTQRNVYSYKQWELFTQTAQYKDAILSVVVNNLFMRRHLQGTISKLDMLTLDTLYNFHYEEDQNNINEILGGTDKYLVHIDRIKGYLVVLDYDEEGFYKKEEYFVEDFLDNPPLQLLHQKDNFILLGAFDGLYLIKLER